jgi:hypothetical protein
LEKQKGEESSPLDHINEVAYEIKIWQEERGRPGELVYWKQNLLKPVHKVETQLKASTQYVWTVRAQFLLDGQRRLTEWGLSLLPWVLPRPNPRTIPHERNPNYYRFQTPSQMELGQQSMSNTFSIVSFLYYF